MQKSTNKLGKKIRERRQANQLSIRALAKFAGVSPSYISSIESGKFSQTHKEYHEALYKRGIPTAFIDKKTKLLFMGIISGVSSIGNLQIQLEDDTIVKYGLKEISFAKV